MEIQERLIRVLRDQTYLSYAQFSKGRVSAVKAAFDGDPDCDYAVSHIPDISYAQVCPPIFFADIDGYAHRLMSCAPRKKEHPIEYAVYLRGACILILNFAGLDKELVSRIRPSNIDFQSGIITILDHEFSLSRYASDIIKEFFDLPRAGNAKGEGYSAQVRPKTFLFSMKGDDPVKVGALNKAVRFTVDTAHERGFETSAWIASVNGDFVRVRALVESGCDEKEAIEKIAISRARNLGAFIETYRAFQVQCP